MRTVIRCPLCTWEMEEPDVERFVAPVPALSPPWSGPTASLAPGRWLDTLVHEALLNRAHYIELTLRDHLVRHWAFRQALFAAAKDLAKELAAYPS